MNTVIKFPSIGQYRSVIKNIKRQCEYDGQNEDGTPKYKHVDKYPILSFYGTTKSHGTNSAIRQDKFNDEILYQSRERIITPLDDNAGFATYMYSLVDYTKEYIHGIRVIYSIPNDVSIIVYGEWCGGNIQTGVAITGLPKMFLAFAIRVGTEENSEWIRSDEKKFTRATQNISKSFYSISTFGEYWVVVDLNNPEYAQNEFVELVDKIETKCPIGEYFGKIGCGEGAVLYCIDKEYQFDSMLKIKGERHSASKVKTIANVDIERVEALKELVDTIITDNRLNQMVGVLKDKEGLDIEPENIGAFIKLTLSDALKEELDTIIGNGFDTKSFSKEASQKIRKFALNYTK